MDKSVYNVALSFLKKWDLESLKTVINEDFDVNHSYGSSRTLLEYVFHRQYIREDIVLFLLQKGFKCRGLLFEVCVHDLSQVLEFILNKGYNINAQDNYANNALNYAIKDYNRVTNTCKILIKRGVDVNVENNFGMTPLIRAIKDNYISLLEELLNCDRINVNYQTKYGETALMKAVMNEEIECVKLLLSHKNIDINFKNNDGETALFYFSKGDSKRKRTNDYF
jgi:ankyrin repeat protein